MDAIDSVFFVIQFDKISDKPYNINIPIVNLL